MKYKVKMVVQRNGKPKIRAAECDKICPAGKSVCCCRVMFSDIQERKRRGVYPTLFDQRPSKSRTLELESVERLKENKQKVNPAVPFPKMILDADSIKVLDTIAGEIAYGGLWF
ncbi:unnamed protein product [Porites lobata]|uniref:Uncharacterized protein n=1 Tax=Porites lobata TaxID=104759 RepID=A0ABN8NL12_9CNID|nr:unnamed protein product [Porites lobata]